MTTSALEDVQTKQAKQDEQLQAMMSMFQSQLDEFKNELKVSNDLTSTLKTELQAAKDLTATVQTELQAAKDLTATVQTELQAAKDSAATHLSEFETAKQTISSLQAELQTTKELLESQMEKVACGDVAGVVVICLYRISSFLLHIANACDTLDVVSVLYVVSIAINLRFMHS